MIKTIAKMTPIEIAAFSPPFKSEFGLGTIKIEVDQNLDFFKYLGMRKSENLSLPTVTLT